MPYTTDFPFSFIFPQTMQHEEAQGEVHFAQQDIFGDTFSLGDSTFLFYVNKSLGADEGRGLSVNFDY